MPTQEHPVWWWTVLVYLLIIKLHKCLLVMAECRPSRRNDVTVLDATLEEELSKRKLLSPE